MYKVTISTNDYFILMNSLHARKLNVIKLLDSFNASDTILIEMYEAEKKQIENIIKDITKQIDN